MPAIDLYQKTVVNALLKDHWHITSEQPSLTLGKRRIWLDIEAQKDQETILIEVKGFENLPSPVDYLESVVGQYSVYRSVLVFLEFEIPLFLAVPLIAYRSILSEPIGQAVVAHVGIKMLVFSPEAEEIVQWIP